MDKGTVAMKINNGEVKVKGKRKAQEKPKAQKPEAKPVQHEKLGFTTEQLIEVVKSVGHAASSREISDKLGIKDPDQGRAYVRSRMQALVKDKKIVLTEPKDESRCTFLYSVVE
jgi:hypothetical protein